ncbi:MAG: hypothetical protein SGI86_17935, partial [Deltaproteobacteria bacterium]|nr:hypothetical protein [Deltaproteobacteria bacterium]
CSYDASSGGCPGPRYMCSSGRWWRSVSSCNPPFFLSPDAAVTNPIDPTDAAVDAMNKNGDASED